MIAGFEFESKKDTFPDGLSAALILDAKEDWVGGMPAGTIPGMLLVRLFWKGDAPDIGWLCERTRYWANRGAYVVLANELNHPNEFWGTENPIFRAYDVYSKVNISVPSARLIWVPPSPGFGGYESWFTSSFAKTAIHAFCGSRVGVHAYGTAEEIEAECWKVQQLTPDCERFLTEWNYGPAKGKVVDLSEWAKGIPGLLTWLDGQGWTAAIYYQYKERNPDYPHETPVDAAGTDVEAAVLSWKAPSRNQEPPVVAVSPEPQISAPVPVSNQSIRLIDISNNNGHVDLRRVKEEGRYDAVILKVSEDDWGDDDFFDSYAAENLKSARDLGMGVGIYTFLRPSKSSPSESIHLIERALEKLGGLHPGESIWLDVEDEKFNGDLHVWLAEALDLGTRVFGFSIGKYSADWYTSTRNLEHEDFSIYPTWWASYQGNLPAPQVGWGPIRLWQNGVLPAGSVPGVAGACDVSVFFGTIEDFRALGRPGAVAPIEVPPPQKTQPSTADVFIVIERHLAAAKAELGVV